MFNIAVMSNPEKFQPDRYLKEYTENVKLDSQISKRVLVVDDDDILREFLDQALTAINIEARSVSNAYDALDLLINEKFELVLTDIQMPGMDGWELATNIKKSSPEIPVILMTGMQMEQVKKIKNNSYDFILHKPFSLKELEATVTNYLSKGAQSRLL
jgi:DNA-binding NtrC family response regulator